jgi:hypothetical protein
MIVIIVVVKIRQICFFIAGYCKNIFDIFIVKGGFTWIF